MRARMTSASRGVTVVEVMMALAMFAIGASGVIAMEKVTVVANQNAKNVEVANEVARTWIERLRGDAVVWNFPSRVNQFQFDITDTQWLSGNVQPFGSSNWFRPNLPAANIYGVHDSLGRDDPNPASVSTGPFCVQIRLTWIRLNTSMRAEVLVYWLRQGITNQGLSVSAPPVLCGASPNSPPAVLGSQQLFHMVVATTEIRQNPAE
jgi:prepilin-type N-terminal cleavage/methylation domain-containing protein